MFCGGTGQGFPFSLKDGDDDVLYDVLEFHNVEIPKITGGVLT